MKCFFTFLLTTMLFLNFSFGQNRLVLQHKTKLNRHQKLKTFKVYEIKTADSVYYSTFRKFTDSTVLISNQVNTGRDTSFMRASYENAQDSFLVFYPIYRTETIEVLFSEITHLKTQFFNSNGILGSLSWFALGSILAIPLLPVAALDKSNPDGLKDWIGLQKIMLGVSIPSILLLQINKNVDLEQEWRIVSKPEAKFSKKLNHLKRSLAW